MYSCERQGFAYLFIFVCLFIQLSVVGVVFHSFIYLFLDFGKVFFFLKYFVSLFNLFPPSFLKQLSVSFITQHK